METFLYLIPISVILGLIGLVVFLWTLRNGQYDDLDGSAERIIYDEDRPKVDNVGQAEAEAEAEAYPHPLTSPGEDPGPTDDATRVARPMGPGSAAGEGRGGEEDRRGEKDPGDGKAPAGDKAPAPTSPKNAPKPGHTP
jgi:cbb3-type cytochrome oxidase maturation protein